MSIFGDVDELTGGFADALGERLDNQPSRRGPTPLEAYLAKFQTTVPSWQALGSAQAAGAWAPTAPSWQSFGQRQDVGLWQPATQAWQQAGDFFGRYRQAKGAREDAERAAAGKSGTAVEAGDWSGPATADDNATLTAQQIDGFIQQHRPDSPLIGQGQAILDAANRNGVSAALLVSLFWKESSFGATAGPGKILAGVKPGGQFTTYGTWGEAINGAAQVLAQPNFKGKSVQEQVANWYAGPEAYRQYGVNATDAGGGGSPSPNGSVQDYLSNFVAPTYAGLGVSYNQGAAGTRRGVTVGPDGAAFPVVGWTQPVSLHWGDAEGTGATDVMAPAGSQVVAVRGGQVTYAAYDPTGGWAVDIFDPASGLHFYYAHLAQQPRVQAGQRVSAGTSLGLVGNTGNASTGPAHLHIGIGPHIRTGTGPLGGTGEYPDGRPFDAVGYLNSILQAARTPPRPATTGGTVRY